MFLFISIVDKPKVPTTRGVEFIALSTLGFEFRPPTSSWYQRETLSHLLPRPEAINLLPETSILYPKRI